MHGQFLKSKCVLIQVEKWKAENSGKIYRLLNNY